ESSPTITGHRGFERAYALRGDDRYALGLAREAEEFLIADRVVLANRSEVLILVAEKQDLAEMAFGMSLHRGNAIEHRTLEVELHHHAQSFRKSCIHPD